MYWTPSWVEVLLSQRRALWGTEALALNLTPNITRWLFKQFHGLLPLSLVDVVGIKFCRTSHTNLPYARFRFRQSSPSQN